MAKRILCIFSFLLFFGPALHAQDIAGDWQGTLPSAKPPRITLHIAKTDNGGWNGELCSIDQGPDKISITSVALQGQILKLDVSAIAGVYEGTVGSDGASIQGTWTQGKAAPLSLKFERSTKETAWPSTLPHARCSSFAAYKSLCIHVE
jgi:hypothetical protein